MNELIILGGIQVMIWVSIIIYRMLKKCIKNDTLESDNENNEDNANEELPLYEPPPPKYTEVTQITSNEPLVLR